jgi:hypothetical protein
MMQARLDLFPLCLYGAELLSVSKGLASTFYEQRPVSINVVLDPQMGVRLYGEGDVRSIDLFYSRCALTLRFGFTSAMLTCSLSSSHAGLPSARMTSSSFCATDTTIASSCSRSLRMRSFQSLSTILSMLITRTEHAIMYERRRDTPDDVVGHLETILMCFATMYKKVFTEEELKEIALHEDAELYEIP